MSVREADERQGQGRTQQDRLANPGAEGLAVEDDVAGLTLDRDLVGILDMHPGQLGLAVDAQWRDGVIEAERVTPASRTALLMGRLWRDVLQLLVQALILVGLGYVMGMVAPLGGAVLGIALTLLIGAACAAMRQSIRRPTAGLILS